MAYVSMCIAAHLPQSEYICLSGFPPVLLPLSVPAYTMQKVTDNYIFPEFPQIAPFSPKICLFTR